MFVLLLPLWLLALGGTYDPGNAASPATKRVDVGHLGIPRITHAYAGDQGAEAAVFNNRRPSSRTSSGSNAR